MNYWVGVIVGCIMGIILSVICFLCVVKQNENLTAQVILLREEVAEHEEIMRTYKFFNKTWERLYNKENQEDFEK